MACDQHSDTLVVGGRDRLPDRSLDVALILQPLTGPSSQGRLQIGLAALELVEKQLGEEVVVAVPLSVLVQRDHKQVGAGELAQEESRILPTRHRVAKRTRQAPQYRRPE